MSLLATEMNEPAVCTYITTHPKHWLPAWLEFYCEVPLSFELYVRSLLQLLLETISLTSTQFFHDLFQLSLNSLEFLRYKNRELNSY